MLIPSYAAGSIIGKGGQTIVQLQKETGATIKLSKSKDFYPGEPQPRGMLAPASHPSHLGPPGVGKAPLGAVRVVGGLSSSP